VEQWQPRRSGRDPRQTFQRGDLVHVAKDLGQSMSHFRCNCDAVVVASYADLYVDSAPKDSRYRRIYQLQMKNGNRSAWYFEDQLTLVEKNRLDLLYEWRDKWV
jgi:hypothetical protein